MQLDPAMLLEHGGRDVASTYGLRLPGGRWHSGDPAFHDIQALRRGHVARARLQGIELTRELPTARGTLRANVFLHLVAYAAGFIVFRLTLRSDALTGTAPATVEDFDWFHRCMIYGADVSWTLTLGAEQVQVEGDVRTLMDWLFFDAHERARGTPASAEQVDNWTSDQEARYRRLDELVRRDGLATSYPVIYGTHYEFGGGVDHLDPVELARSGAESILPDVAPAGSGFVWLFGENRSVLVCNSHGESAIDPKLDAFDTCRIQLLEYLTLRRAALRTVQRATQEAITEGERVSRTRVAAWDRLIASVCDDYVLHDQLGVALEPIKRHLRESDALRDLSALEQQVRSNVASFSSQIAAASARAGVLLGVLFGIIAATALAPAARHITSLAFGLSRTENSFVERHLVAATLIDVGLIVLVFLCAFALYQRVSSVKAPARLARRRAGAPESLPPESPTD